MLSAGLSQRRRDPYSEISRPPKEKKKMELDPLLC